MKTAIIGYGWVGKAMHKLFPDATLYDRDYQMLPIPLPAGIGSDLEVAADSVREQLKERVNQCDVAFIGVPTPVIGEGKLDTSIVEEVISWCECSLIVVRSTVNPGDCDRWSQIYGKHIVMQPEYLGETVNHPMINMKDRPFLVIGGQPEDRKKLIDLYTTAYNANVNIRQTSAIEAEVIKLTENRAISFKVAQCQELYDVCQKAGLDYYTIREAVYGDDPRFNLWWTFVFPEQRGFQSKCIPKDVFAWCAWAESLGYDPQVTRALLAKNKEWLSLNA